MGKNFTNFCIGTYALVSLFLTLNALPYASTREKKLLLKHVKSTIPTHYLSQCALVTCGNLLESFAMTLNTSHSSVNLRTHLE